MFWCDLCGISGVGATDVGRFTVLAVGLANVETIPLSAQEFADESDRIGPTIVSSIDL